MSHLILAMVGYAFIAATPAKAQMEVTCPNSNPADTNTGAVCTITSTQTNVFVPNTHIAPGMTLDRYLIVHNEDDDESCDLTLSIQDDSPDEDPSLAAVLRAAIYSGSTAYFGEMIGGVATDYQTYQDLYDTGIISLGTLPPNSTQTYTWLATLDGETIGNEYQGKRTIFDFDLTFSCGDPDSGNNNGGDDGGGDDSGTEDDDNSWVCEDPAPSSAPGNFRIVSQGINTVTLAWDAVSPVTHYALVFTRSDGEAYGAANIGNTTQYTITNLSGGFTYTFEVMGVNGCMPGDRATTSSGTVAGGIVSGRPLGPGGQVLGVSTEEEEEEPEPTPTLKPTNAPEERNGEVAGVTTCVAWRYYIPWILLLAQGGIILVCEYLLRKDHTVKKHILAIAVTLTSIFLFYLLRECDCYNGPSLLGWLCKWYWLVAIILTAIIKFFSYAFVEEVEEEEKNTEVKKVN